MVIFCFQNIEKNSNAIKSISRSGVTFTATKLDNTTFTFTQQDNNTTYAAATTSALGLVKIGSNITNSSGTISIAKANVTAALGYTPPTSNTNNFLRSTTESVNITPSAVNTEYTYTPKVTNSVMFYVAQFQNSNYDLFLTPNGAARSCVTGDSNSAWGSSISVSHTTSGKITYRVLWKGSSQTWANLKFTTLKIFYIS